MKDLPHGETQYDPNEVETFEAMALRVARETFGSCSPVLSNEAGIQNFATRIRDELCKGQEPFAVIGGKPGAKSFECKEGISSVPLGTRLYLHPAPIPADTALKQYGAKLLRDAAEEYSAYGHVPERDLIRMADELEQGK